MGRHKPPDMIYFWLKVCRRQPGPNATKFFKPLLKVPSAIEHLHMQSSTASRLDMFEDIIFKVLR